jgi:hypothetical protein
MAGGAWAVSTPGLYSQLYVSTVQWTYGATALGGGIAFSDMDGSTDVSEVSGTKLFGSSEYIIGDANSAMQTQSDLLRNYVANAPNPSINIVDDLTENGNIDTISGQINLSSDLVENYPHLIDGTLTEELFHFQQLQSYGLIGGPVTDAQSQAMESEVVNLMLNAGFQKY